MQQRLMILGSMYEFTEIVKKAKKRGIYTVVCDNHLDGPAKKYADKAYDIDIYQIEEIAEVCKKENIDGIITSFSDILFECLVKIAHKAGLKTYCTPEKCVFLRDKSKMRQMFRELGVPAPMSKKIHRDFDMAALSEFSFPVVMKPVDGFGSRGIFIVESIEEIRERFDETAACSTQPDTILIEQYNDGHEYNIMTWVVDGEVHVLGVADRDKSSEVKGEIQHVSRVAYPSRIIHTLIDDARDIIKKVADYTEIRTGVLSMQFFYKPGEGIEVCECAGRFLGYEREMMAYGGGLDIDELLLDYVYDEESMKKRLQGYDPYFKKVVAGLYFHGHEGTVADLSKAKALIDEMKPLQSVIFYEEGETISHKVGSKPYLIRLYIQGENYEALDELTEELFERMEVPDLNGRNLVCHNDIAKYMEKEE